ncbi:MAG: Rossmann-like and DUF2520 domain-containing protein [Bacteroidota bacterium]
MEHRKGISNIAFIGAGKIAHSLAPALFRSGFIISSVISRSAGSARHLSEEVHARTFSSDINDLPHETDLIVLSVPDSMVAELSVRLAQSRYNLSGKTVIHLSGALDASVLASAAGQGAFTASLHIMQTFPSKQPARIEGAYAAVESSNTETAERLSEMCRKTGLIPFRVDSGLKAFYHLSGVFASNFMVSDFYNAAKSFYSCGIEKKSPGAEFSFERVILPIASATLNNLKEGAGKAISGPVERGDEGTVARHLLALSLNEAHLFMKLSYIVQSLSLLDLLLNRDGELSISQKRIRQMLISELKKTADHMN